MIVYRILANLILLVAAILDPMGIYRENKCSNVEEDVNYLSSKLIEEIETLKLDVPLSHTNVSTLKGEEQHVY